MSCIILYLFWGCERQKQNNRWTSHFPQICSFSSPRPIDINQDNILDFVMGAGLEEFMPTDSGVIAVDGRNGELLWVSPSLDQIVGSPTFIHINDDKVKDVIIGGRNGELYALNGRDGEIIWHFENTMSTLYTVDQKLLNFYNPQLIKDVNGDGKQEILISYGGLAAIPSWDPNRPAGKLLIIDSQNGNVLAEAMTPDSLETFMSPICVDLNHDEQFEILFGTGGEIYRGNFFITSLQRVLEGDISDATCLISGKKRGFIAPPVVVDINDDQVKDIIVNAVEGRIIALDGRTFRLLWEVSIPNTEVYSSLAVGQFTGDATPDVFTNLGVGVFPLIEKAIQVLIDGSDGTVVYRDTLGFLQISSPLAADVNHDGQDEIFISINHHNDYGTLNYYNSLYGVSTELLMFQWKDSSIQRILGPVKGINPASTPWIGDIDNDQKLDIIYPYMFDTVDYKPFNGMKLLRREFPFSPQRISWSSYMGNHYNGIYP